ncbi:MAG: hypothetical protein P8X77_12350 [Maritimibacter sp.]
MSQQTNGVKPVLLALGLALAAGAAQAQADGGSETVQYDDGTIYTGTLSDGLL